MNESKTYRSCQSNHSHSRQSYSVIMPILSLMPVVGLTLIMTTFVAF